MVAFSGDDRVLAVGNETGVIRLVEAATGREYVRIDAPMQTRFKPVAFTADGSQLIVLGLDSHALHVLDLRGIRRGLADLGLDWDAPPFPDPPAKPPPPNPPVKVDLGTWTPDAVPVGGPPEMCVRRWSAILKDEPDDVQAYLERSYARTRLGQLPEAAADLERVLALNKDQIWACNALAWLHATGPEAIRDPGKALPLAERAVKLAPGQAPLHARRRLLPQRPLPGRHPGTGSQPETRRRPVRPPEPVLPGHVPPAARRSGQGAGVFQPRRALGGGAHTVGGSTRRVADFPERGQESSRRRAVRRTGPFAHFTEDRQ
jgi:hypothetical protein